MSGRIEKIGDATLYLGDCLDVLHGMADNSLDACVTDPPYGLSFMGKGWDYDVPSVDIWREVFRVLKPGAHVLAFAGTRTQHRMAVNIEDAGFEIRDMIAWVYGSGFPKSLDVSKAIDKAAGVEFDAVPASGVGFMNAEGAGGYNVTKNQLVRKGEPTDAARQWQGWGTALKPALEPITVARKPLIGTVAANVQSHGTGAINIDGCRVGIADDDLKQMQGRSGVRTAPHLLKGMPATSWEPTSSGRWPANLIHDGSEEVLAGFPDSNGSGRARVLNRSAKPDQNGWGMNRNAADQVVMSDAGSGSAARFFYCAKASKADRDEGLEGHPSREVHRYGAGIGEGLDPNAPAVNKNFHPTVKPTALMRYLCRLVTPPGGTVLDPFMGSGSTGKAAALECFAFVGAEREEPYYQIAHARIAFAVGTQGKDAEVTNHEQRELFDGI